MWQVVVDEHVQGTRSDQTLNQVTRCRYFGKAIISSNKLKLSSHQFAPPNNERIEIFGLKVVQKS